MLYEDVLLLGKDIKEQRRTTREELKSMHDFPACPFIVMFQILVPQALRQFFPGMVCGLEHVNGEACYQGWKDFVKLLEVVKVI